MTDSSHALPPGRGAGKSLLEIPDEVLDGLEADRQPDRAGAHAGRVKLLFAQLAVGRAGRMDDEALRVTNVRQVGPERHAADEILARLAAALALEREHRAR